MLFICTGNYYRSRYAEALFNFYAMRRGLNWRAFSRGLAIHEITGDISPFTQQALRTEGIPLYYTGPTRFSVAWHDLDSADRIVALKRSEHLPMMKKQFPEWADRITYWEVHDRDVWTPDQALPQIRKRVMGLVEEVALTADAGESIAPNSQAC